MKKAFIKIAVTISIILAGANISLPQTPRGMVFISGGTYQPLYGGDTEKKDVKSFYMDKYAVTNGEFLEFVKVNPKWQKSKVKKLFADHSYLKHWKSDLELGETVNKMSPVTNISWFAAKAYAQWKGKRLPTTVEWEFVAQASRTEMYASKDKKTINRILNWYSKLSVKNLPPVGSTEKNYWGVYDLFGLVWEWVYDFNSSLVSGESRGDASIERNLFCGSGSTNSKDVENYPAFMRFGFRSSLAANYCIANLGFRCVKDTK